MSELGHFLGFCICSGEGREEPDGTVSVPILLCDPNDCPCWVHDTREEEAA